MILEPNCRKRNCVHFVGAEGTDNDNVSDVFVPACAAYPKGIPSGIAYGNNPHTEPENGDHGIQYEKRT